MARLFDDAFEEYLRRAGTCGLSGYPFTFACWYNVNTTGVNHTLIAFCDEVGTSSRQEMRLRDAPDSDVTMTTDNDGSMAYVLGANYTTDVWQHACAVFAGAQERHLYLNGGNKASNTTDSQPWNAGLDETFIGADRMSANPFWWISGHIAEAAIWNLALIEAEVAALAKGFSPLLIRPDRLVAYWPLIRGINDRVGGYNMTASGTTVSEHPRVIYPSGIIVPSFAPATFLPRRHWIKSFRPGSYSTAKTVSRKRITL